MSNQSWRDKTRLMWPIVMKLLLRFLCSGTALHHHDHCVQTISKRGSLWWREHHVPPETRHHHPRPAGCRHHLLHCRHCKFLSDFPLMGSRCTFILTFQKILVTSSFLDHLWRGISGLQQEDLLQFGLQPVCRRTLQSGWNLLVWSCCQPVIYRLGQVHHRPPETQFHDRVRPQGLHGIHAGDQLHRQASRRHRVQVGGGKLGVVHGSLRVLFLNWYFNTFYTIMVHIEMYLELCDAEITFLILSILQVVLLLWSLVFWNVLYAVSCGKHSTSH